MSANARQRHRMTVEVTCYGSIVIDGLVRAWSEVLLSPPNTTSSRFSLDFLHTTFKAPSALCFSGAELNLKTIRYPKCMEIGTGIPGPHSASLPQLKQSGVHGPFCQRRGQNTAQWTNKIPAGREGHCHLVKGRHQPLCLERLVMERGRMSVARSMSVKKIGHKVPVQCPQKSESRA